MWSRARLKDGSESEYGLGWFLEDLECPEGRPANDPCRVLEGRRMVHHGGSLPGFRAMFAHIPRDSLTVIVLTNTDDANPAAIARGVAALMLSATAPHPRR